MMGSLIMFDTGLNRGKHRQIWSYLPQKGLLAYLVSCGWAIVRHLALGRLRLVSSGPQSQYLNRVMGVLKTLLL